MFSQGTSWRSCRTALPIIGPRHTTGVPFGSRKPRETIWDAELLNRTQPLRLVCLEPRCQPEHGRDVGPRDVCVDEPHLRPGGGQRNSEVGGDGRLAHAPLVRGHRDHVAHALDRLLAFARVARPHLRPPVERNGLDSGKPLQRGAHIRLDDVLQRAGGRCQLYLHAHGPALDGQLLDHPQRDDVTVKLGVVDGGECGENGVPVYSSGSGHYGYGILMAAVLCGRVCAERAGEPAGRSRRKRERRAVALEWLMRTMPTRWYRARPRQASGTRSFPTIVDKQINLD